MQTRLRADIADLLLEQQYPRKYNMVFRLVPMLLQEHVQACCSNRSRSVLSDIPHTAFDVPVHMNVDDCLRARVGCFDAHPIICGQVIEVVH